MAEPDHGLAEENPVERFDMTADATPNPFQRSTRISYAVPRAGEASVAVYDIAGRPVRSLANGHCEPGRYSAVWDGRNDAGDKVASGVYLYKYTLGADKFTGKLLLTD